MNLEQTITDEEILKTPVGNLPFPTRARRIFRAYGIENIEQLLKISDEDLICVRGFYHASLNQTKQVVADYAQNPNSPEYAAEKISKGERTLQQIRELAARGMTRKQIAEEMGRNYEGVSALIRKNNIEVKSAGNGLHFKVRPEIDRMIREGKSLNEMAVIIKQSRERMRQYINSRGTHGYWRTQREKRKRIKRFEASCETGRKQIIGNIVRGVLSHSVDKESDFATKKAGEYFLAHPRTTYIFEQLEKVFRVYQTATEKGKILSLEEIEKKSKSGIMHPQIGEILHRVGLEPMNGSKKRRSNLLPKEVNAIWCARNIRMPQKDLAYFLGMNSWNVIERFERMEVERPSIKNKIKRFGGFGKSTSSLSYALSSQIYEASDAGYFKEFSRDEMAGFFDTSTKVVDYALANRGKIAPIISSALEKIYPNRKNKRPYLTKGDVINN